MLDLNEIGRLPTPGDNCAIAIRTLSAGTAVRTRGTHFTLSNTVLEGHRFATALIPTGSFLLSWGVPFGRALRDIGPGEYICNGGVLNALRLRELDFALPDSPNFVDDLDTYQFDPEQFRPAPALPFRLNPRTFMGIPRPGKRGVGTRNMIVLLGVNALVSGFLEQLEKEVKHWAIRYAHIDDIVPVTHTEGGQTGSNNQELLLRTLAGYILHPNVGAVLLVDADNIGVTNGMVRGYAAENGYPIDDVLHQFMSLRGPFGEDLERAKETVKGWLPLVNDMRRSPRPLSELKIALQCGGSDAFSGISGNPLVAWVAKEIIEAGGSAVLAETDELIGAESYMLQKVRDAATIERFMAMIAKFQARAAWHGHSAHGNVSGGNLYRGLYNIYLKSLGAAAKRHPDVRLDYVIAYGERVDAPGYYFMDSPGNDLESIAGQVASGCNLIYFVTGNGSVTNFPFVPTIKVVTTSARYALLAVEMDVNAGAYLDGSPMAELVQDTIDLSLAVASGQPCAGEKARHAQVQIWRNWQLTSSAEFDLIRTEPEPAGRPLPIRRPDSKANFVYSGYQTESGAAADRVGLVLPSSLCSAQIANLAAARLNEMGIGKEKGISRFVSLVHTEGCGASTQPEFVDLLVGYMTHPLAASCLVLEHGCETTHNDFWRQHLRAAGCDPQELGWASVQLDGGVEAVLAKIAAWFSEDCQRMPVPETVLAGFNSVGIALMTEGMVDDETAAALAYLTQQIVAGGGTVVLAANDALAANMAFTNTLAIDAASAATLAYARRFIQPGFQLMENPSFLWAETMAGLGATGVEMMLAVITSRAQQSHPFIPVLQAVEDSADRQLLGDDSDLVLMGSSRARLDTLLAGISAVLSRTIVPKLSKKGNYGFQITRGRLGVSL